MPVMDGFDAARQIFKYQRMQGIEFVPVVAVTAYDDSETVETCLNIGMSDVLHKPIDMYKLSQVI